MPPPVQNASAEHLADAFTRHYGAPPALVVRAPGRVNLIGEHTDYNDGFVLPTTLGQATYVALRPRADRTLRLLALNYDDDALTLALGERPPARPGWAPYAGGAAHLLDAERGLPSGADVAILGEVPIGAGLSSSAALEVGVLFGLSTLFGLDVPRPEIARLGQRVEHDYAGVQCGIMDQSAVARGRAGHALALDCRTLEAEHVPLRLGSAALLVVDSRAPRDLADSAYNARRAACERGVAALRAAGVDAAALRDVSPEVLRAHRDLLDADDFRRCLHVVEENARVHAAVAALRAGDAAGLGALMDASHDSLRDLYEVSSPPLDLLVSTARARPGVHGARLTGAGFGGCIVVLAARDALPDVTTALEAAYTAAFDRAPAAYPLLEPVETSVVPL